MLKKGNFVKFCAKNSNSLPLKFKTKALLSYFIVWLLFCMVDRLELNVLRTFLGEDYFNSIITVESIVGSFSALIGGILCDKIGRKPVITYGFSSLGLAYAMLGIFPTINLFLYFYCLIDGISGGFLLMIFTLLIWGDLSDRASREFYYVIGNIPFFIAEFFRTLLSPKIEVPITAAFFLASFFLFIAVFPLLYAPETLPEKVIRERELREYVKKAKKLREKYEKTGD